MKNLVASRLPMLSLGALLLVGCGGSSTATGPDGIAGSSSGGSSSGGSSSGGSSSGGSSSGGASSGGAPSGGAGSDNRCTTTAECTVCAYPTAPKQASDCYCASCATTALTRAACAANQAAWHAVCAPVPRPCPAIACIQPPTPICTNNQCTRAPAGG